MNSKNVKIGNYYRHKDTLTYGWAKVLEIQKAINEKWKAMFTEQAMANAKLINKEEN